MCCCWMSTVQFQSDLCQKKEVGWNLPVSNWLLMFDPRLLLLEREIPLHWRKGWPGEGAERQKNCFFLCYIRCAAEMEWGVIDFPPLFGRGAVCSFYWSIVFIFCIYNSSILWQFKAMYREISFYFMSPLTTSLKKKVELREIDWSKSPGEHHLSILKFMCFEKWQLCNILPLS